MIKVTFVCCCDHPVVVGAVAVVRVDVVRVAVVRVAVVRWALDRGLLLSSTPSLMTNQIETAVMYAATPIPMIMPLDMTESFLYLRRASSVSCLSE